MDIKMRLVCTMFSVLMAVGFCAQGTLGMTLAMLRLSKDAPLCYPFHEEKVPHALYTGNSSMGRVPVLEYKISELTSFDSEFELRTLDPEGIILEDGGGGVTGWLLLAVRKGRLSVQIGCGDGRVTVNTGSLISDGLWKKIVVAKREAEVSVSVNGDQVVSVQKPPESRHATAGPGDGLLRIAIGASLSLPNGAPVGINAPLDACMRSWDWVKQNSSALLTHSDTLGCWENIVPGSFFPGDGGHVGFLPKTFGNMTAEGSSWVLSMELTFRPVDDTGVLFAILDPHGNISFSLSLHQPTKDLVLHLQDQVFGSSSAPSTLCSGESQFLQLQVREGQVTTELGGDRVTRKLEEQDFHHLRAVWSQPGTLVYLGGLPGGRSSFHGCLQAKIQGADVDLDLAQVKMGDVRSHSCPSALDIRGK